MSSLKKIKVYHFDNGSGGGTFSVVKNLLKFSNDPLIENHVIYTINKDIIPVFEMPALEGVTSQQVFYFSSKWNFYYTCRQLAKLFTDEEAIVVAHDWLELGMMSNLGLQNPVVHFLHGDFDYYYDLAQKHQQSIDEFVGVSPVIYNKLLTRLAGRATDIHYCRFPVPVIQQGEKGNEVLKIFYCVRNLTDERKQFKILPLVNAKLQSKKITLQWTIIGGGMEAQEVYRLMRQEAGISLFSFLPNEEVLKKLPGHDIFILPSLQEGFPVSVVEAMKAGLVPLVSDWNGATAELIIEGETGFYFKPRDTDGYASKIETLHADRNLLNGIAKNGIKKANELFDPIINTKKIEEVYAKASRPPVSRKPASKVYGSRLDAPWIPNFFTKAIRMRRNYLNEN